MPGSGGFQVQRGAKVPASRAWSALSGAPIGLAKSSPAPAVPGPRDEATTVPSPARKVGPSSLITRPPVSNVRVPVSCAQPDRHCAVPSATSSDAPRQAPLA